MSLPALLCAILGAVFMVVAALGILRFRDLGTRLHCAGKASSLGIACLLGAAAWEAADPAIAWRCLTAALVFVITGPLGCHALARAAWRSKTWSDPPGSA